MWSSMVVSKTSSPWMATLRLLSMRVPLMYSARSSGRSRRYSQNEVAGHRVDGLDDVLRVRHEHHSVAHQRRPLLASRAEGARPHHAQVADVVAVDLVEGCSPQPSRVRRRISRRSRGPEAWRR